MHDSDVLRLIIFYKLPNIHFISLLICLWLYIPYIEALNISGTIHITNYEQSMSHEQVCRESIFITISDFGQWQNAEL